MNIYRSSTGPWVIIYRSTKESLPTTEIPDDSVAYDKDTTDKYMFDKESSSWINQ